jgi:hypothetical protein
VDISNAFIPVNVNRPLSEGANPQRPQTKVDALNVDALRPERVDRERVSRETVDPDALQRRVEQKQASQAIDVSRFQSPESFSMKTQQAINSYHQTELASQEFDGGVLVGIDTFA